MGRWVTSKGRRIYIPDEGEENPFAKKDDDISMRKSAGKVWVAHKSQQGKKRGVRDLDKPFDKEEDAVKFADTIEGKAQEDREPGQEHLKNQINKDFDLKEKQIAENKKQSQFGADMNNKISDYQNKFLKKKSDKELDEIESNLKKSTSLVGTSVNDQVALAAIENERKNRRGKKK